MGIRELSEKIDELRAQQKELTLRTGALRAELEQRKMEAAEKKK
jgi:outer membrane murein-binding lipoprotein Lpp